MKERFKPVTLNIPIFLSSDNNYAPFVATTMASICDNTQSFCNFYVLDGGITEKNKKKICELKKIFSNFNIEFIPINLEKEFKNFKTVTYISKAMYSRLLIPYVKTNINKAIYLDVDIIVKKDILSLYNIDLEGYALGAIWDKSHINYNTTDPIIPSDKCNYFNSGVLLIDCNLWRKNDILKTLLDLEKKYRTINLHPDEAILNKYFDRNYKIIPAEYNYLDYYYQNNVSNPNNIVIRHFATERKPWLFGAKIKHNDISKFINTGNIEDFWKYAKMTSFLDNIEQKTIYTSMKDLYIFKVYDLLARKAKERIKA